VLLVDVVIAYALAVVLRLHAQKYFVRRHCLMSANGGGVGPGADADSMISLVPDYHLRNTLLQMQAESRCLHEAHHRSLASFSSMLQNVATDVRNLVVQSGTAPPVVYPQFIEAAGTPTLRSNSGSVSSFTPPSSLTDSSEIAGLESVSPVVLKCLFCPHFHVREKSHCQHYSRLRDRVVDEEHYTGQCVIPGNHWIYRNFGKADQSEKEVVSSFITTYLSFLASSNEKSINPERAARLSAWLQTIAPCSSS
jgi:hypothetical protein